MTKLTIKDKIIFVIIALIGFSMGEIIFEKLIASSIGNLTYWIIATYLGIFYMALILLLKAKGVNMFEEENETTKGL